MCSYFKTCIEEPVREETTSYLKYMNIIYIYMRKHLCPNKTFCLHRHY